MCSWGYVYGILAELFLCVHDDWSYHLEVRTILVVASSRSLFPSRALEIIFTSFDQWELAFALLDLDHWMACGHVSNCAYSYVEF